MELHGLETLVPIQFQWMEISILLTLAAALAVSAIVSFTRSRPASTASRTQPSVPWNVPQLRLVALALPLQLLVEAAQLPLHGVWVHGTWFQIGYALAHCTLEDLIILLVAYRAVAAWNRDARWYRRNPTSGGIAFVLLTLAYSGVADSDPIRNLGTWGASRAMPSLPFIGIHAVPVLQWTVVPLLLISLMQALGDTYSRRRYLAASSQKALL